MYETTVKKIGHWTHVVTPWFICLLGATFYSYESLLRVSPGVMVSDLMNYYHINAAQFGHLFAFYYYVYAPMQLGVGILMDRYGPRRLLTVACLCCSLGTYFFVCSHHLYMAEFGRFLVGLGSSFAFVGVLKLGTMWLPPNRFAFITGSLAALGMIGAMTGDIFLNTLVHRDGWQLASYHAAYFGLILSGILFVFLRGKGRYHNAHNHHTMQITYAQLLVGLKRLATNSQIWINGTIGCLLWISLAVIAETWGIQFLEQVYHFSDTQAAAVNAAMFLGWAVGGPIVGSTSDYINLRRLPITIGSSIGLILSCWIIFLPRDYTPAFVGTMFFLIGFSSSVQTLAFPIAREISGNRIAGTSMAMTNMMVMVSGYIQPLSALILEWYKQHFSGNAMEQLAPGIYPVEAYQLALSIIPLSMLVSLILTWFLKETHAHVNRDTKLH